ncbi:YkgJ family cysteine cluster protein [Lewinella sp. LCG006]|uniref:YkgJ family cysteine cluster protein n=1 Tax=Lewinella sp. LCG006 TaxID=3231911 RepID=UPI00345FE0CF
MKAKNLAEILPDIKALAKQERKANRKYFARIGKRPPRELDATVSELHEEVFKEMDCLACANCCKTTSPIFRDVDIERVARHLGIRPAELVDQHLHLDEEGDYVLNFSPCPFLGDDNYCSIYEARPRACREYPHTDRKNFHQILDLTLKNTSVCPATFRIVQRLREVLPG